MQLRLLQSNDMHGTLDGPKWESLQRLRDEADLYFDTGDAIKTGNLGIPFHEEPVWSKLAKLRCTASVLGNRETHILESVFKAKIAGATHPILCGNLRKKDGSRPLASHLLLDCMNIRIGVIAVMVPMVTERMSTRAASAYLWDAPIPTACQLANEIRPNVDLLICLTHIGHRQDQELAQKCPDIDIIMGGHSHTVLQAPEKIGKTYICQGGSHNRYAGVYQWDSKTGLTGGLIAL